MCATCGCGDDTAVTITNLQVRTHQHGDHDHSHAHADDHCDNQDGTSHAGTRTVSLGVDILAKNDARAAQNRLELDSQDIVALNLMSSPGSGKTTLLERTIRDLSPGFTIAVLEGDQETVFDAERIRATGASVVQVNTGAGCHLDADMVADGLRSLAPPPSSLLFIENVGNLVCPAMFDLGERSKVVVISVTEGADKPLKYPHMFRAADLVVVNKIDLAPYVDFDIDQCLGYARQVNPGVASLVVSATRGDGLDEWYAWLQQFRTPDRPVAAASR